MRRWITSLVLRRLALSGRSLVANPSTDVARVRALTHNRLPIRNNAWQQPTTVAFVSAASKVSSSSSFSPSSSCQSATTMPMAGTGYLNAVDAAALDVKLMSTPGFSLEQLMELAGLAVAEAVYQVIPPLTPQTENEIENETKRRVVLVCGPGNNGGDGLVAARHLCFFGNYDCIVVYPKRSTKQHFVNLVQQCEDVGISIVDELPPTEELDACDAIVDAIFGFSFKGSPREPFGTILHRLKEAQEADNALQTISVDVPSGWNVDEGDVADTGFVPDVLISLTAPKLCSKEFHGRHFIGGRFLPPRVARKYNIRMPPYPGVSQVMEVTREHIEGESQLQTPENKSISQSDDSWAEDYYSYMAEKEQAITETEDTTTPPDAAPKEMDVDKTGDSSEEAWEAQYAAHCIEKEAQLDEEDAKHRAALRKESNA